MPLIYDETLFNALYSVLDPTDGSRRIHYSRELYSLDNSWIGRRAAMFAPGSINSADVLVVGCGFGWLIEQAIDIGAASAVGIDSSPYIQANKATESRGDVTIIDATVGVDSSNTIKNLLQSAGFKRAYNLVIDEDAASSHSDAELPAFFDACEDFVQGGQVARVVHLVTPASPSGGDSQVNWKTMAEWKALRPTHTWIDIRTGQEEV